MESHASTSSRDSAIAYALTHGLVISTGAVHEVTHIPFTLQPTPIPRKAYERAVVLAPVFNQLVDSMARDISFLCESLTSIAASDPFIGGLLELLRNVYTSPNPDITKQPPPQQWMLGIHRSDYMLEGDQLKQVEINTISSAFPALSTRMCELHDYVSKRWGLSDTADTNEATTTLKKRSLLYSESAEAVPRAMAHAVRVWCSERGYPDPSSEEQQLGGPPPAIVAFVVSPTERNIADQRMMEQVLWDSYRISSVRLTLEECSSLEMNATSGDVFVPSGKEMRGKRPIALAYFRSSYAPTDFYNKECWRGREILERSSAIKCPSIPYHLCTSKKIQQLLCSETVRRRFVNETDSALLASCMALQYDLSLRSVDPKVQHAIDRSIEDFHSHVLKPQREGGGNLIHGEEVATILTRGLTEKEATEYILMEMIHGTEWRNTIVAKGKEVTGNLSSELGIYGIFLGNGEPVASSSPAHSTQTFNAAAGYLIRSKIASVADGGVVSGIASLSSALLFDSEML